MKLKLLVLFITSLLFTGLFQNCSSSFQTIERAPSAQSTNPNSSENSNQSTNIPSSCVVANGTGEYLAKEGRCVLKTCDQSYHPDPSSNSCISDTQGCAISNGTGQKQWSNGVWGNCTFISCNKNFHRESTSNNCQPNVRDCNLDGKNGNQYWNENMWSVCTLSSCPSGQHLENNSCVANSQSCAMANGTGKKTWSGSDWGVCEVATCSLNFHPDPSNGSCLANSQACQNATGSGVQTWNGGSWGVCQMQSCIAGFHLEANSCISDNKTCNANNKIGSQKWNGTAWSSCLTCNEAFTPLDNKCESDFDLVKNYVSFFRSCWRDGVFICPIIAPTGYIGVPTKLLGNTATIFQFPINYSGVSEINLNSSHVLLSGTGSTGCQKSITASSAYTKLVTITGCSGNGPLNISIAAQSAKNAANVFTPAIGPSTSVMISNSLPKIAFTKLANLEYDGKTSKQKFDFYYPNDYQSRSNIPIVIWIHGGGWSGGDKDADSSLAEKIAQLGFFVFNVNYTLATQLPMTYPQPALATSTYSIGPDDIHQFVSFVKTAILQYNGDVTKITISGGSAGGHLSLVQATRADNSTQFHCTISAAGPTDLVSLFQNQDYPVSRYLVGAAFGNSNSDLTKYSPTKQIINLKTNKLLLLHQIQDNLVPVDQALRLAANVRTIKTNVPLTEFFLNTTNPYPLFNPTPEQVTHVDATEAFDAMVSYINQECR